MQEVAEEAGLSAGALYRYFDGKAALFAALAAWAAERRRAALSRLEEAGEEGGLASVVSRMLAALASDEAERSVRLDVRLWAEALDDPNVARAVRSAFASVREPVAAHARGEREAGRLADAVNPEAVGRVVVSLLAGLELQRAHEEDLDLDSYRAAVRSLLSGLEAR